MKIKNDHIKKIKIKKLSDWISNQQINYNKKKYIMKNEVIYNEWTNFKLEYKQYFISNEESWFDMLDKVKEYINKNKKRPSQHDKNKYIKQLGRWIYSQQKNYKKKIHIMKNSKIYNYWNDFITNNKEYFMTNDELWYNSFIKIKKYIIDNNKRPSSHDKDIKIKKLGSWIETNNTDYRRKENNMKIEKYYNEWTGFLNKFKNYFYSKEEIWFDIFQKVKDYINENKKRPSSESKDKIIQKYGMWVVTQLENYKKKHKIMKNEKIYNIWSIFLDEYKEYFISKEEIWYNMYEKVKKYINENNKRPSQEDKNKDIKKIGCWINTQNCSYKTKTNIMKNEKFYIEWENFKKEYSKYFI